MKKVARDYNILLHITREISLSTRCIKSKNKYTRNIKHKNKNVLI